MLTKQERKALGGRFAGLLIRKADARPENLPELIHGEDWKASTAYERQRVCFEIVEEARGILLKSGYPRDLVEKMLRHNNRY